ncbi:hypothetical protein [Novipirellula caenicola]|uniref:hypothetical protein n=1 Tax=Novipirellula caenicola TaxID=1536901 RepID=UPI0031EBA4CF
MAIEVTFFCHTNLSVYPSPEQRANDLHTPSIGNNRSIHASAILQSATLESRGSGVSI